PKYVKTASSEGFFCAAFSSRLTRKSLGCGISGSPAREATLRGRQRGPIAEGGHARRGRPGEPRLGVSRGQSAETAASDRRGRLGRRQARRPARDVAERVLDAPGGDRGTRGRRER